MFNLSKYIIIISLSILCSVYSNKFFIEIGAICSIYCIIDLIFDNLSYDYLIEKITNKANTTYKANTYNKPNTDFKSSHNSKKFLAGSNSTFKASDEDLKEFGNINHPDSITKLNSHTILKSTNNDNIFANINIKQPNTTQPNTTQLNENPFNNIIENLKNGLNELDTINNNNCINVIDNFKNKIKYLNHYINDMNNDLQIQGINNQSDRINNQSDKTNNVCPIVVDNYSYV